MRGARERSTNGATVYIGPRPTMSYVFEVVAQLHSGAPVLVKARGAAIAKAVDVVEVVRHRFLEGEVAVGAIRIDTERLTNRTGRETNVSSIAIPLERTARSPPGAGATTEGSPSEGDGGPTSRPGSPPPAGAPG